MTDAKSIYSANINFNADLEQKLKYLTQNNKTISDTISNYKTKISNIKKFKETSTESHSKNTSALTQKILDLKQSLLLSRNSVFNLDICKQKLSQ